MSWQMSRKKYQPANNRKAYEHTYTQMTEYSSRRSLKLWNKKILVLIFEENQIVLSANNVNT